MKKRIIPFVPALKRYGALTAAVTLSLALAACGGGGGGGTAGVGLDTSNGAVDGTADADTVSTVPLSGGADNTTGGTDNTAGGTDKPSGATPPAGVASLVDGRVGDNPFYDDGNTDGFADGRTPEGVDAAPSPVSIRWDAVSIQLDQQAENELAGYRIYYGHKPGNYEYVIEVADPGAQSYTVADLPSGTYYFAATAVDAWDQEGPFSSVAAVTIN